jgi:hypothetical protein
VLEALALTRPLPDALKQISETGSSKSSPDARFHQHNAVGKYLAEVAVDAPLLIALEDLQWADAATLTLLGDLPELLRDARVLVLTTSRTEEGSAALTDALTRLARHEGLRLTLAGLAPADVALLVAANGADLDAVELTRRSFVTPSATSVPDRSADRATTPPGGPGGVRDRRSLETRGRSSITDREPDRSKIVTRGEVPELGRLAGGHRRRQM